MVSTLILFKVLLLESHNTTKYNKLIVYKLRGKIFMKKWLSFIVISLIAVFALAACGGNDDSTETDDATSETQTEENGSQESESGETYKVGATQIVEHPSLDRAFEGFKAALADAGLDVEYDYQNAQADQNNVKTISDNFVADNVDLIFANSTPSAEGALNATKEIPIVFTSVTDPVAAKLVEAMDKPGPNITGVTDLHPDAIKNTVEFIDKYFEGAEVGIVYNAGEPNSVAQIEAIKEAAEGTSLTISERTVANSSEVHQAAMTLAGDVDVFYIFTDNTVVSALESVVSVANEQQIPLVVGEPDSLQKGGFATFGIDYYTIGYRAGELAVEILTGQKTPDQINVEYPPELQLFINKEAAELQGVEWNAEWDDIAEFMETSAE